MSAIENKTWTFSPTRIDRGAIWIQAPVASIDPIIAGRRGNTNVSDPYNNWYVRPKLVLEPTDNLKITLGYVHTYIDLQDTFYLHPRRSIWR